MSENRYQKASKTVRRREGAHARGHANGYIHVISPATASEMLKTLQIQKKQIANALRALKAAGVEV